MKLTRLSATLVTFSLLASGPAYAKKLGLEELNKVVEATRAWTASPDTLEKPSQRKLKNKTVTVRMMFRKRGPRNEICDGSPAFGQYKTRDGSPWFDYSAGWTESSVRHMKYLGEEMKDPDQDIRGPVHAYIRAQERRNIAFQCKKTYRDDSKRSKYDIASSTFWFRNTRTSRDKVTRLPGGITITEETAAYSVRFDPTDNTEIQRLSSGQDFYVEVDARLKPHPGYKDVVICHKGGSYARGTRDTCKVFAELMAIRFYDKVERKPVASWSN